MAALRAERLGFGYVSQPALLKDVTLSVRPGELVVLMGRNGSGKTTLLKLLGGMLTPKEGRVFVEGHAGRPMQDSVGLLFQNPDHQMIAPTVEEEIALGLELRGEDPIRMRGVVNELLTRFQLSEFRNSPPEALSGGQKQRVALAAIMAWWPPFLLFDEPDSFLDAPSRRELMRGVDAVRGRCGILWVVPRVQQAPAADRYYLLRGNTVEETDRDALLALTAAPAPVAR